MDQALNSQKTPHTSPLRASYGMSFVSILMKNDRVIKGFYCITLTKPLLFQPTFPKVDQRTVGKWLIHGAKHRKDKQLQILELSCRIS